MTNAMVIYRAAVPDPELDEAIKRCLKAAGGVELSSGMDGGERELEFQFAELPTGDRRALRDALTDIHPRIELYFREQPSLSLKVCRTAVRLLNEHETAVANLFAEISVHAVKLSPDEALDILSQLTLSRKTGIVPAWEAALSKLVSVLSGGDDAPTQ